MEWMKSIHCEPILSRARMSLLKGIIVANLEPEWGNTLNTDTIELASPNSNPHIGKYETDLVRI